MTAKPISVSPEASLGDVLYLLNRYQLSRLPVTEGCRLLGIITRSDIIKAEANHLDYDHEPRARCEPAYTVYQTRSPAIGKGRILLPVAHPDHILPLLEIAGAIALYHQYEIECLQVICIPSHLDPAQAEVDTVNARQLMSKLETWGKTSNIALHSQIMVATDVSEAILEAVNKEHINLLIMGWRGKNMGLESIFGNIVDVLIKQVRCDLMLVKLGTVPHAFPQQLHLRHKWLIPSTGGERIKKMFKILPALATLDSIPPKIQLCQVHAPDQSQIPTQDFYNAANLLEKAMNCPVILLPISAYSVSEAIVNLTRQKKYGLVVLGGSNENLLQQVVKGNIPEAIAKNANSTVIIFRSYEQ